MIEQMIFTLVWTVLFCLGWYLIGDEDNLNIRHPYTKAIINVDEYEERIKVLLQFNTDKNLIASLQWKVVFNRIAYFVLKPIIGCVTCFGSFWGVTIFVTINGFTREAIPYIIINCIATSFINTFIWKLYAKLDI